LLILFSVYPGLSLLTPRVILSKVKHVVFDEADFFFDPNQGYMQDINSVIRPVQARLKREMNEALDLV
jgi:superfamily II DNA/RNA helicase